MGRNYLGFAVADIRLQIRFSRIDDASMASIKERIIPRMEEVHE